MRLFHFTCEHGHQALGNRGFLVPQIEHPYLHIKVSWLTTEETPDRTRTGLGMTFTRCDRMQYRYVVSGLAVELCRPWPTSPERAGAQATAVWMLEEYGDPEHWWITDEPVPARLG